MATQALTSKQNGALFIQPDGPNTEVIYMGCYHVDDVQENKGDITPIYCIENGDFVMAGSTEAPPEVISLTVNTLSGVSLESLETITCPVVLYMTLRTTGDADVFGNWRRAAILDVRKITSRTLQGWVRRNEDVEMVTAFGLSAGFPIIDAVRLQAYRQTITGTTALNGIHFCSGVRCADGENAARGLCEEGFITTDAGAGVTADVLFTSNGAAWTAGSADPFAADEHILAGDCFALDADTTRHLVARGVTDGSNPAEIGYSDDGGATWTLVNVGSVNGQFVPGRGGLFALNRSNLYLGTDDGYIYKSTNGGETWTAVESGVIHTGAYNAIHFKDRLVGMAAGDAGVVALTVDGGQSWSVVTAPSADNITGLFFNGLFWWVTTDGGELYYSGNNGTTWTQRSGFTGSGTGVLTWVDWLNKFEGMATHTIAGAGYLLHTIDGGYTWERVTVPTNTGFNMVKMCSASLAYVVGEVSGGTGFVAKVLPKA